MRRGTPGSSPAPNSASGRLLPVEVNPAIRQSLTVFADLDGHRPQQVRLPLVQRHTVHDLAQRRGAGRLGRRARGAWRMPLTPAPASREPDHVDAVREGLLQALEHAHPRQHVTRLVRDALARIRVVLPRRDEPQVLEAEVLHRPHHVGDVHQVLGLLKHDDDHPTSSKIPKRSAAFRSPSHRTHPSPPLQTSCPARRSRPGSISLTIRSKPMRPPTCERLQSGGAIAAVMRYPGSVRRQAPRIISGPPAVPPAPLTRRRPASPPSGTISKPIISPSSHAAKTPWMSPE